MNDLFIATLWCWKLLGMLYSRASHSFFLTPSLQLSHSLSLSHPSLIMFDLTFGFLFLFSLIWLLFLSSHPSSSLSACPHLPYYDVPQGSDLGPFSLKLFYFCIISSLFVITKIHTEPMTWTNMYKHLIYASSWRGLKIHGLPFWQKSLSMRLFISDFFFSPENVTWLCDRKAPLSTFDTANRLLIIHSVVCAEPSCDGLLGK